MYVQFVLPKKRVQYYWNEIHFYVNSNEIAEGKQSTPTL